MSAKNGFVLVFFFLSRIGIRQKASGPWSLWFHFVSPRQLSLRLLTKSL